MDQHDQVRRSYDAIAEQYHSARSNEVAGIELFKRFQNRLPSDAKVVDAGCGAGDPVTKTLVEAGFDPIGLDIATEQLRLARGHVPTGSFVQGDLTALPFYAGQFDGAVAFYSIIHVPRDRHEAVYHELHRVLAEGGLMIATLGIEAWEGTNPDWLETGVAMHWSFPALEDSIDLIREAGFEILAQSTVDDELGSEYASLLARA